MAANARPHASASPSEMARFRWARRGVGALLVASSLATLSYSGLCLYAIILLASGKPLPIRETPAALGLAYRDVSFPAREDGVTIRGWLIPGVEPDGRLTTERTIIMIHGVGANRTDPGMGLLRLSGALARRGYGVLAFDMRGEGESQQEPLSLGYFEQRDALGAVDFLRSGPLPYPELGRPRVIGGWGVSLGGATLLLAAAREPAIRAVVADSAFAAAAPLLERELPKVGHTPPFFTPGVLRAAQAVYGIDFYAARPVDVVAQIAPRPLLLIHGGADHFVPLSNQAQLAAAARQGRDAHVTTWTVPGADHAQSYNVAKGAYVNRLVSFFDTNLP